MLLNSINLEHQQVKKIPRLYHLSFREVKQKIFRPRLPTGLYESKISDFIYNITDLFKNGTIKKEPDIPRISGAPSIEGCFAAIETNLPQMIDYNILKNHGVEYVVYELLVTSNSNVVPPEVISDFELVYDALYTKEHWILTPTRIKLLGRVNIQYDKRYDKKIRPYGKSTYKKRSYVVNTSKVKVTWL